tara:strand:- start:1429 stop:2781 length:1353 start_codon:yes stop_codon:yes gene_type:complete
MVNSNRATDYLAYGQSSGSVNFSDGQREDIIMTNELRDFGEPKVFPTVIQQYHNSTKECGCTVEVRGNVSKVIAKGKGCTFEWHGPSMSPKIPKKKPVWYSVDELPADLEGSVYCSGCDNDFYADMHSKGKQHRKTGYGHYYGIEAFMSTKDIDKLVTNYAKALALWESAHLVNINVKPSDLPSQQKQPNLDAKPENVVWQGIVTVKGVPTQLTFTARDLKDFSIRRTVKRTANRDWDLYQRQTQGVDILDDIATNAVVKFLNVLNEGGSIRNPYTYLSRCIDTAITDYRTERRRQRLTVVPLDVLDWLEVNVDEEPELHSAALDIDYHEAIKARPKTAVEVHTLVQLFKSKGLQLPSSHLRAVANALSGKNNGLHGNATTKRYIRSVLKKLKDSEDDTLSAIYLKLTGNELPRPQLKIVDTLKATLDVDIEPEMPVTRWVTVDGKRVYS